MLLEDAAVLPDEQRPDLIERVGILGRAGRLVL